jgi:hypothetical protein
LVQQKVVGIVGPASPIGLGADGVHVPGVSEGMVFSLSDLVVGMPGQDSGTENTPVGVRHARSRKAGPAGAGCAGKEHEPDDGPAHEQGEQPRVSSASV